MRCLHILIIKTKFLGIPNSQHKELVAAAAAVGTTYAHTQHVRTHTGVKGIEVCTQWTKAKAKPKR